MEAPLIIKGKDKAKIQNSSSKYSFAIANHSVLLNLIHILSARRLVEYFEVT